jgi:hypothetical protein
LDIFALGNLLFFMMVLTIWGVMAILEKRDKRPLPPRARWSGIGAPGSDIGPKFANGWICRSCWTANRSQDVVCQRCHGRASAALRADLIASITPDELDPNADRELAEAPPERVG